MPLDEKRVFEFSSGESVGRPHIAQAMIEQGYATSVKDAFDRFLGIGRPGYVERFHLEPVQSVRTLREAGGVPVWAHPGTSRALGQISVLVENGLMGIEAYHPEHGPKMRQRCLAMAEEHDLTSHWRLRLPRPRRQRRADLGSVVVPYEVVSQLRSAAGR